MPVKYGTGDYLFGFCVYGVLVTSPIWGGLFSLQLGWIDGSLRIPVHYCVDGAVMKPDGHVVACSSDGTASIVPETFRVHVSPKYASQVLGRYHYVIQAIPWTELTSENICQTDSLIFQQYSLPNGICSTEGKLLVGGDTPLPTYSAAMITMIIYCIFVLTILVMHFLNLRPTIWLLVAFSLNVICLSSSIYTLTSWDSSPIRNAYIKRRGGAVVPLWNKTLTYAGMTSSFGEYVAMYKVQERNEIIPSSSLGQKAISDGYGWWMMCVPSVLIIELLLVLCVGLPPAYKQVHEQRIANNNNDYTRVPIQEIEIAGRSESVPREKNTIPSISENSFIVEPSFECHQVPRPSRPAPGPSSLDVGDVIISTDEKIKNDVDQI